VHATDGALAAGAAAVAADAVHVTPAGTHAASGALLAGSASIDGTGLLVPLSPEPPPIHDGSVGPASPRARRKHRCTGALHAGAAHVSGEAWHVPTAAIAFRLRNEQRKTAALLALVMGLAARGCRIGPDDTEAKS